MKSFVCKLVYFPTCIVCVRIILNKANKASPILCEKKKRFIGNGIFFLVIILSCEFYSLIVRFKLWSFFSKIYCVFFYWTDYRQWIHGENKYSTNVESSASKARTASVPATAASSVQSKSLKRRFYVKLANESIPRCSDSEDPKYDSFNEHETGKRGFFFKSDKISP